MSSDSDEVESSAVEGDAQPKGRAWSRRRVVVLAVVLVVLGAAAAGGTVWWRDRDRVDEGVVREHVEVYDNESYDAEVMLPAGRSVRVRVAVGYDRAEFAWDGPVRPPRGGRYVEVTWSELAPEAARALQPAVPMTKDPARLELRTAGRTFALGTSNPKEPAPAAEKSPGPQRAAVVALEGASSQLFLDVVFAGRRQSVDVVTGRREMGSFAGLYDPSRVTRESWLDSSRKSGVDGVRLYHGADLTATREPYVQGLGWAREGREWLVVGRAGLRASSVSSNDGQARLGINAQEGQQGAMTVNGRPSVRRLSEERYEPDSGGTMWFRPADAVFDVPSRGASTVHLSLSFLVEAQDAESMPHDRRRVTVTDVVRVPAPVMAGAR